MLTVEGMSLKYNSDIGPFRLSANSLSMSLGTRFWCCDSENTTWLVALVFHYVPSLI